MRCVRPRSITSHSAAETIRGSRSCGKMRSVAFVPAVHREGDALVEEGQVRLLLAAEQLVGCEPGQFLVELPIRTAGLRLAVEHLVEGVRGRIPGEEVGRGRGGCSRPGRRRWVLLGSSADHHATAEPVSRSPEKNSRLPPSGGSRASAAPSAKTLRTRDAVDGGGLRVELDLRQLFDRAPERLLPGGVNQVEVGIGGARDADSDRSSGCPSCTRASRWAARP